MSEAKKKAPKGLVQGTRTSKYASMSTSMGTMKISEPMNVLSLSMKSPSE